VTDSYEYKGVRFYLTDTAGVREATDAVVREQAILSGISQAQVALNRIQLSFKAVDLARTGPEADAAVSAAAREADQAMRGLERPIAIALKPQILRDSGKALQDLATAIGSYAGAGRGDLRGGAADSEAASAARRSITDQIARAEGMINQAVANARGFTDSAMQTTAEQVSAATRFGLVAGAAMLLSLLGAAMLLMLNIRGLAEVYSVAKAEGIDIDMLADVISTSSGNSFAVFLLRTFTEERKYGPSFAMNLVLKDLANALKINDSVPMPLTSCVYQIFKEDNANGVR